MRENNKNTSSPAPSSWPSPCRDHEIGEQQARGKFPQHHQLGIQLAKPISRYIRPVETHTRTHITFPSLVHAAAGLIKS
jgi:hypothetical protein